MLSRFSLIGATSIEDLKAIIFHANEMLLYAKETQNTELLAIAEYGITQSQARITALTNNKPIARQHRAHVLTSASAAV